MPVVALQAVLLKASPMNAWTSSRLSRSLRKARSWKCFNLAMGEEGFINVPLAALEFGSAKILTASPLKTAGPG